MPAELRPYRPEDLKALENVFNKNVPDYFGENELADYRMYLQEHGETYYVAESDGELCGGGGYHITETGGRLSWYVLDPESQGKGIGRMLVEKSVEALENVREVLIEVWTSQKAEKFFGKFGFREVRREDGYWAPGLDLVVMRMEVRSSQEGSDKSF